MSYIKQNKPDKIANSSIKFIQSNRFATVLKVLAIGEFIVDKLPFTSPRIKPAGVTARVISGGLSAAIISKAKGTDLIGGFILGSTGALTSTFTFYFIRKKVGEAVNIYDPVLGVIEDALVISAGLELAKSY